MARLAIRLALAGALALAAGDVRAEAPVVVWPTLTPVGDEPSPVALHRPLASEDGIYSRAAELDASLREAVADLGFQVALVSGEPHPKHTRDLDLLVRASGVPGEEALAGSAAPGAPGGPTTGGVWVVSPRLEAAGKEAFLLRLAVVAPKGREIHSRVERVEGGDVAVRGIVMLRDLLAPEVAAAAEARERERTHIDRDAGRGVVTTLRSPGRAALAANGALFGGFAAFAVERASGSDDPRVLYPLLALGTGLGLGSALLASDEWDVSNGDAWVLSGGAWWGAASGLLIADGRHISPFSDRYAWGFGGGLIGIGVATVALTQSKMDDGDALLTNSGGAVGLALGGLVQVGVTGLLSDNPPFTGAGYGAGLGVLAGGALASFTRASPSRILYVDTGVGLGGLAGAALASPLVFQNVTKAKARGFAGAIGGAAVLGGAIAFVVSRPKPEAPSSRESPPSEARLAPFGGVIGASATKSGSEPAYGVGVHGTF